MKNALFPTLTLLAAVVLLQGCAGGPREEPTALEKLNRGHCPASIVTVSSQSAPADTRYGPASESQLLGYRELELENCRRAVRRGDATAMRTLASFWRSEQNPRREASSYLTYLEYGDNDRARGEANAALYRLYTRGGPGLPADEQRAFEHLSQAVILGVGELHLAYANALFERNLYGEARHYYIKFAATAGHDRRDEACEANLRLGDIYFRGLGEEENWFLGYYFWQRGLDLAEGGQWGSCHHDNFIFGDRYYREKERKNLADSRSAALSPYEIRDLQRALNMDWGEGLSKVKAMPFSTRGRSAPAVYGLVSSPTTGRAEGWPGWTPLREQLCELSASTRTLSWADLFELRSGSVWTVLSSNGQRTTRGSAVAVGPRKLLSNCHLIQRPDRIELQQGSRHLLARVSSADHPGDRCVLATSESLPNFVRSAQAYGALRVGAEVAAIGNPQGLDTSLSRGIIAQKRRNQSVALIQTDTTLSTGSSGGGLFDQAGNLIGITSFQVGQGADLNFAIAVDEFCR